MNDSKLEDLKDESLLLKFVGRQVIVREKGKGIHIFLECPVVQDPPDNDPYIIKEYKSSMRTVNGKPFILCVWCKEILNRRI